MRDVEGSAGGCGCDPEMHRALGASSGRVDEVSALNGLGGITAGTDDVAGAEHPEAGRTAVPPTRRRFLRTASLTALGAPALLAAACSPGSSSGPKHVEGTPVPGTSPATSRPSGGGAFPLGDNGPQNADAALLAAKYQGLKPFADAPPPPDTKPVKTDVALPPVVDHIPGLTDDQKIVFLTIDDGAEKDPVFLDMVKDFKVPITLFLCDMMIKDDYSYFTKLLDTGYVTIQNHTLTHPDLQTVSAARQQSEISGQQALLTQKYGTAPYLFRAPYGNSNAMTQQACKDTGLKAIMYWRATFQKQGFQWQDPHKQLHPGDILLAHFRGPVMMGSGWPEMHQLMINLFRIVQDQGFTFARLEDYV